MERYTQRLSLGNIDPLNLLGHGDANLRVIERRRPVSIVLRDSHIKVEGEREQVDEVVHLLEQLIELVRKGKLIEPLDVEHLMDPELSAGAMSELAERPITYAFDKRVIRPRSPNQVAYLRAMEEFDIVFAIGPAGTGKTYLAVAAAVQALKRRAIERIVLVRPAVEAGESLGFLPGDMQEKVDPYLRPLYDALQDMMSLEKLRRYIDLGVVEIAPLAYMRGRTISDAFVILDEAQNTTLGQMKMFLTRLGLRSRAVITGDITQIDLPNKAASGLLQIEGVLGGVDGIRFLHFVDKDVVRHNLVRDILQAFERRERAAAEAAGSNGAPGTPAE
ncbi:MAG TPA: PhoH family protein [Candidatus Saccharimonadales bacterium]|nr:PhoH family protein [Candidatus Saccharimonadales bacterium]